MSTVSLGVGETVGGSGMAAAGDPLEVGGVCFGGDDVDDEGTAAASSSGSGFTCTSTCCNGAGEIIIYL